MKTWHHIVLYAVCLPVDLVAWLLMLFIRAAWGERLEWETPKFIGRPGGPVLTVNLRWGSFPVTPGTWPKGFYIRHVDKQKPSRPHTWGGTNWAAAFLVTTVMLGWGQLLGGIALLVLREKAERMASRPEVRV